MASQMVYNLEAFLRARRHRKDPMLNKLYVFSTDPSGFASRAEHRYKKEGADESLAKMMP